MGGSLETIFITETLKAFGEGNALKGFGYIVIFFVIWLEVRGLKKQFKTLNETISTSFAKGEERFNTIENDVHRIREDLDQIKIQGGLHGKTI